MDLRSSFSCLLFFDIGVQRVELNFGSIFQRSLLGLKLADDVVQRTAEIQQFVYHVSTFRKGGMLDINLGKHIHRLGEGAPGLIKGTGMEPSEGVTEEKV